MSEKRNDKKSKPILKKILIPMLLLILVEEIVLIGTIVGGGAVKELNQNARDILQGKVQNRKSYVENEMINSWMNVDSTVEMINEKAAELEKQGAIQLASLDKGSEYCEPLIAGVTDDLIAMMRSNKVTGAYIVFNNESVEDMEKGIYQDKPGIYIRDLDPTTNSSYHNSDLLIERAPVEIVKTLNISTDSSWRPVFEFGKYNARYYDFIYEPYIQAVKTGYTKSPRQLGYWSKPFAMNGDQNKVISYSVPLVTEDGNVYGVMGIDITLDYLQTLLPGEELMENGNGTYLLAVNNEGTDEYFPVLFSGNTYEAPLNKSIKIQETENGSYQMNGTDKEIYCSMDFLNLYDNNAPFENDRWVLIGLVRKYELNGVADHIQNAMSMAAAITMIVGLVGSFIISVQLSKPISKIADNIRNMDGGKEIQLERTQIAEIDQLEYSLEQLSRDVINSAAKFSHILKRASVRIAGFEMEKETNYLFITEGFFELFGITNVKTESVTPEELMRLLDSLSTYCAEEDEEKEQYLYKIPVQDGETVYIRLSYSRAGNRQIGLAEDVTRNVKEKRMIEHERDHDLLTGLCNRRSFYRKMRKLFDEGSKTLKTGALIMLDLDNLKYINDTYGHDYGDKYIRSAAEGFRNYTPEGTVTARISGDEFYLFFYGYESKEEIRRIIEKFKMKMQAIKMELPLAEECFIKMSGGVSWYPEDAEQFETLLKYSDFAMYQVKKNGKGDIKEFEMAAYLKEESALRNRGEFLELLRNESIEYYFQPIVDASNGEVYAYEALMRGMTSSFRSPVDILKLAAEEKCLPQIEELTWKRATKEYFHYVAAGVADGECRLFINSLADQCMSLETVAVVEENSRGYLDRIVIELTEEDELSETALNRKRLYADRWKAAFALDDYGSGYNSEKALLNLKPEYIKIDREIIEAIQKDGSKQKIVENTVSYAHERDMRVIAEGIENEEELKVVIGLNVDYLQGFYIGKPNIKPQKAEKKAVEQICSMTVQRAEGSAGQKE